MTALLITWFSFQHIFITAKTIVTFAVGIGGTPVPCPSSERKMLPMHRNRFRRLIQRLPF
jgi:hypothetical protein